MKENLKTYTLLFILICLLFFGGKLWYAMSWSPKDVRIIEKPKTNQTLPTVPLVYPNLIGKG